MEKKLSPAEVLKRDDAEYMKGLMLSANNGAKNLLKEESFLNIMRLIFEITGFDTVKNSTDTVEIAKHGGKREVWSQIKEYLFAFNPEALNLIEHHKETNRQNRKY